MQAGFCLQMGGRSVLAFSGNGRSTYNTPHTLLAQTPVPGPSDGKIAIEPLPNTWWRHRARPPSPNPVAQTRQFPTLNRVPRRDAAGCTSPPHSGAQTDLSPSPRTYASQRKTTPSPESCGASPQHGSSEARSPRAACTRTLSAHTQTPTQTGRQAPARTHTRDTQALPRCFPTKAGARAGTRSHARAHLRSPPPAGSPRPPIYTPVRPALLGGRPSPHRCG